MNLRGSSRKAKGAIGGALGRMRASLSMGEDTGAGSVRPLVDGLPYEFSPSFMFHGGLVGAIVQLYVRRGSNRDMTFTDVIDVIPTSPREGVRIYFVEKDSVIIDDAKKSLIKENAGGGRTAIMVDAKEDAEKSAAQRHRDASEVSRDKADLEDYRDYELTLDDPDPVVCFDIYLYVTGPSRESVDGQIDDLNVILRQKHPGMAWSSLPGEQQSRFTGTFMPLPVRDNGDTMTSTGSNMAGLNFAASPGICDSRGPSIGEDVLALVHSSAVFDFDGSTDGLAVAAVPIGETMPIYKGPAGHVSVASIIGQACANDVTICGHRVAHLVCNGFNYMEPGHNFRRPSGKAVRGVLRRYDASLMTINPLQGFGEIGDVVNVYHRLEDKVFNLFDLMMDLGFDEQTSDAQNQKAIIQSAISQFYISERLWNPDAANYSLDTRIVDVKNPDTYPRMSRLIMQLTNANARELRGGSEARYTAALDLRDTLAKNLNSYDTILNATTSIEPSGALQDYYDLSGIGSEKMMQIQAVNIIDYVLWTLESGDLLVIHGAQQLWQVTLNRMIRPSVEAAMRRGVRVLICFDTVKSKRVEQAHMEANHSDVFSMFGSWYQNLAVDLSWSMIGSMMADQLEDYVKVMNHVNISQTIRVQSTATGQCQVLLHRERDGANNFISLATLI